MKTSMDYIKQENKLEMVNYIRNFVEFYEDVIIVNIGTDRIIMDAIAPIVGTMLHENNCTLKVYGTIQDPIHALNIHIKLEEIKTKHPFSKIIGIDACLGDKKDIGKIIIRDEGICAGKGAGKILPKVGKISIIGVVETDDNPDLFIGRSVRLDLVYSMAKLIADIVLTATNSSNKTKDIKFYNRNKDSIKSHSEITIEEVAIN